MAHLEKLISLGDIYILEPTGNYSKLWLNTLLDAGKEVRFISNRDLASYRKLCQWDYKDDYHDATALAYCGWLNINNPSAFLSTKTPEINATYQFLRNRYLNDIQAKLTEDGKIDPNFRGLNSLKQWGKARVGDKLVKLLFKELIEAYRRHQQQ